MFKSIAKITLAALALSSTSLLAQEPRVNALPVAGDDICKVIGIAIHKEEIVFGVPKYISLRTESMGSKSDNPVDFPAATKWTLMTYFPPDRDRMIYWLSTDENHARSGTIYFPKGESESTEWDIIQDVYTIQGVHSGADVRKQPAWKMELLASDQKPIPESTSNAH